VLHLLRVIKHASDEHTQENFADTDIGNEDFVALDDADTKRIAAIVSALQHLAENTPAPKRLIERALTESQLTQYRDCCNQLSSLDSVYKAQDFPMQFVRYLKYVQQGDRYEALAQSARRRKTVKRDYRNRTAAEQYSQLAETSYESALMELAGLLEPYDNNRARYFDYKQAELIRQLLDRPVDCSMGNDPNADQVCVPRLRTSKSKYTIEGTATTPSKQEHRVSCQCDAIIPAALELLYGKQELREDPQLADELRNKLKAIMNKSRRDD
jgi:hypothetical protein